MKISPENFPEPYQSLNENGILIDVNKAWLSMLGYKKNEVIGKSFKDFLSENEKKIFKEKFEVFKEIGVVHNIEYLLRHKHGHYIASSYNGQITSNSDGKKITQCIFHDKTADFENEYIYKELFNYASNAIIIYESYNNGEDFILLEANPKAEEIDNFKIENVVGKKVTEVFPVVTKLPIFEAFKITYKTGITQKVPVVLYEDDRIMGYRSNTVIKLPTNHLLVIYDDETDVEFSKRLLDTTVDTVNSIIFTTLGGKELEWCNKYTLDKLGFDSIEKLKKEHDCICDFFEEDVENKYIGKEVKEDLWLDYILKEQATSTIKANLLQNIYSLHCKRLEFDKKERYVVVMNDITELENSLLELKEQTQALIKNKEKLTANFASVMRTFVNILEEKDSYTAGHSKRVATYSREIAKEMGCSDEDIDIIYNAGNLHDIGKIITPESILLKPGSFNNDEYALMKEHSNTGYEILSQLDGYEDISKIIRHHHEKYNGSGYPDRLKSKEIPKLSRIMTISDSFDAMTTNRVYKPRMKIKDAIKELEKGAGTHFDPEIIPYAVAYFSTLDSIDANLALPEDSISRHRFAYFFKDSLTNVYNGAYLDVFLIENFDKKLYNKCWIADIHNLHQYNKKYSWEQGDKVLQELASNLIEIYKSTMIFRIHGDKFIVLLRNDMEFSCIETIELPENVYVTLKEISLIDKKISSYKDLLVFL